MSDRRPYASRGVPRRATTGWAVTPSRRWPRLVLASLVGISLAGLAVACVVNPFASPRPLAVPLASTSSADVPALAQPQDARAEPAFRVDSDTAVSPTSQVTTLRRWDTNVPGIVDDPVLASRLDQALLGVDGRVGVAVKDLGSSRGAVLDGDMELQSASLYKLPVLYTVFDLGLSMSESLTITDEARSYDSGMMELGPGETLTVAEALERMITLSDNTSAILLGSRVGATNIDASIAALGMDTTHYSLERMTTSALDMLHLEERVANGKAVSRSASADMLHLMLRQRVNDRLPRLLSDNVRVAHKTGNLPGVVNDVGILYGPNSTVAVAALVSDTTDETAAATAIAQIGLTASRYFEDQPGVADRPLIPPAPSRPIPAVWREPHPVPPTPTPTLAVASLPTRDVPPTNIPEPTAAPTPSAPTVAPTARPTPQSSVPATPTAQPAAPAATRVAAPATATPHPATITPLPATATAVPAATHPPTPTTVPPKKR
jgi:beta-lactamase class A